MYIIFFRLRSTGSVQRLASRKDNCFSLSSLYSYDGDIEPEVLTEPIVFDMVPMIWLVHGAPVFMAVSILGLLGLAAYDTVTAAWDGSSRMIVWVIEVLALMGAVVASIRAHRLYAGLSVTVDRKGLTVRRRGTIIRFCTWQDAVGAREVGHLEDAGGKPLWFHGLLSKQRDASVAFRVVQTVSRRSNSQPSSFLLRVKWALGAFTVVVGFGAIFGLAKPLGVWLIQRVLDSAVSALARVAIMCGLAVTCLLALGLALYGLVVLAQLSKYRKARSPSGHSKDQNLIDFIAEKKGRLDAISMVEGRPYAYFEPDRLQSSDSGFSVGITCFAFGAACLAALVWAWGGVAGNARILCVELLLAITIFGVGGYSHIRDSIRLRRSLRTRIWRTDERRYMLEGVGGNVECDVVKLPRQPHVPTLQFGSIALVLKGDDGKVYRVDPRYLIEDES